jgi:hypothetical protein
MVKFHSFGVIFDDCQAVDFVRAILLHNCRSLSLYLLFRYFCYEQVNTFASNNIDASSIYSFA